MHNLKNLLPKFPQNYYLSGPTLTKFPFPNIMAMKTHQHSSTPRNLNKRENTFRSHGFSAGNLISLIDSSAGAISLEGKIRASDIRVKIEQSGLILFDIDVCIIADNFTVVSS